jgi:hypothetical protein
LSFPIFLELKADFVCFSYEENAEDIFFLETYVFRIPYYDEQVVSNTNKEQPIFDEYTSDGDEHNFSMFSLEPLSTILVYDDYESGPWEFYRGVQWELHMHMISFPSPKNENLFFDKNHVYE